MPQVSLYVDDETMESLRHGARKEGISLSQYTARAIQDRLQTGGRTWPPGYLDRVVGSLSDDELFNRPEQPFCSPADSSAKEVE